MYMGGSYKSICGNCNKSFRNHDLSPVKIWDIDIGKYRITLCNDCLKRFYNFLITYYEYEESEDAACTILQ